jgi:anti-sigma regulatory factor (Ser/Thr protein kinase)
MSQPVPSGPAVPAAITVGSVGDGAIIVLTVRGTWDPALRSETFTVLRDCLSAHPAGLIIDLTAMRDDDARSVPAWTSVRNLGAHLHPPALVALCVSPEAVLAGRLQQIRTKRLLPVYGKVHQARTALNHRIPPAERLATHLAAAPHAPGTARRLVDEACRTWRLPHFLFSARLIVTELVANSVQHAGSDIGVTVSRRAERLHLIVTDNDHRVPERPAQPHGKSAVSGLYLVHALASRWGTISTSDGKMIWATPRAI